MRLPNNYGSVVKLSGARRRPYMVRKTIGYDSNHRQIYSVLGYYETRESALQFLAQHNGTHTAPNTVTLSQVYKAWLPSHTKNVTKTTLSSYENSYNHLSTILKVPLNQLKYRHFQNILDKMKENGLSYSSCKKVRSLINMLISYAVANEWIARAPYSSPLELGKNIPVSPHKPFTKEEINAVWDCKENTDIVLLLLYTGMRSIELRQLLKQNVDIEKNLIHITSSKTQAGIRQIPIHPRIRPIIERLLKTSGDWLLGKKELTYAAFSTMFDKVMKAIQSNHTTHDCRHTVATLLNEAEGNANAIRAILGHADGDVTDRVYTHVSVKLLRRTIELLQ